MVKGALSGRKAMRFFGLMNGVRFLRGTPLDPFRHSDEAKLARQLLTEYEADLDFALNHWSTDKAAQITELLDLPEHIRGYGHVRERHAKAARERRTALRGQIASPQAAVA